MSKPKTATVPKWAPPKPARKRWEDKKAAKVTEREQRNRAKGRHGCGQSA